MENIKEWRKEDYLSDFFVNINNKMVEDVNLNDLDVITYILSKQQLGYRYHTITTIDIIYNKLNVNKKAFFTDIKNSFINLCNNNYILLLDLNFNIIEVQDFMNIKPKDAFMIVFDDNTEYFQVEDLTLDKIIQLSKNFKSRFQYVRYYLLARRYCNYRPVIDKDYLIGYMSMSTVSDFIKNKDTIKRYNESLVENKIFHVNNNYISSTTHKNLTTYFGLYDSVSKEEFEKIVNITATSQGYVLYDKEKMSEKIKENIKKGDVK